MNLLGNRLVVAWCGSALQAERVLRALAIVASRKGLGLADIQAELTAINEYQAIDELQLIGFLIREVRGPTIEATRFSWGVQGIEVSRLGTVFAAGSGREAFLSLLEKTDWTNAATGNEFQVAHALLGALTNEEYGTGNTILNRWGGGFEAVTFSQETGHLEKVGDILHTFWRLTEESKSNSTVDFLPMFYKTTYWRDALIIRSARFDQFAEKSFKLSMNDLDLVPPLLKNVSDYDLNELGSVDFSYRAICCHVLIEKTDGRDILLLVEQHEKEHPVALELDGRSGRLHISSKMSKAILDEARARSARV